MKHRFQLQARYSWVKTGINTNIKLFSQNLIEMVINCSEEEQKVILPRVFFMNGKHCIWIEPMHEMHLHLQGC